MRFYKATSFLFPRHYPARMFALCFGAVHIPLIAFLALEAVRGQWHWGIFIALLFATILGSAIAILGIWGLLAPIEEATRTLRALRDGKYDRPIPVGGPDLAGELLESVAHARRTTEERLDELQGMATTDLLTGLGNRRGFVEKFEAMGAPAGTLALLDLNNFKRVNDLHGHTEGDRVLRAVAERIGTQLGQDRLAARWGGDEFIIFFADRDPAESRMILERFQKSLVRRPVAVVDAEPVGCSFGLAEHGEEDRGLLAAVIARADEALYREKRERKAGKD